MACSVKGFFQTVCLTFPNPSSTCWPQVCRTHWIFSSLTHISVVLWFSKYMVPGEQDQCLQEACWKSCFLAPPLTQWVRSSREVTQWSDLCFNRPFLWFWDTQCLRLPTLVPSTWTATFLSCLPVSYKTFPPLQSRPFLLCPSVLHHISFLA